MTEYELLSKIAGSTHKVVEEVGTGRLWLEPKVSIFASATEPSTEPGSGRYGFPGAPGATEAAVVAERARLNARYAALDERIAKCSGCKAAKTRLAKGTNRFPSAAERRGECQNHYSSRSAYYATSPLSETYWSS